MRPARRRGRQLHLRVGKPIPSRSGDLSHRKMWETSPDVDINRGELARPNKARQNRNVSPCSKKMKERVLYFDLETQKSAEEVGGWGNKRLMKVSVAVIYDCLEERYKAFTEDRVSELIQELVSADLIVGFNIKRFDWEVLKAYSNIDFSRLKAFDLLEEVSRVLGRRISLDHLARVTLKEGKIADGLQAIRWFREGNMEKLTEYCKHDVELTRRLHEFGKEKGCLFFEHHQGGTLRIPVKW